MAFDTGAKPSVAGAVLTDVLPPGVSFVRQLPPQEFQFVGVECSAVGQVVTCTLPVVEPSWFADVEFEVSTAGVTNGSTAASNVSVSGGDASIPASVSEPLHFDSSSPEFGFADFDSWFTNADGTPDTQAGSHPYELTVMFDMNNVNNEEFGETAPVPSGGHLRTIEVSLPSGIIGDPTAVPRCTRREFDEEGGRGCPPDTQIGVEHFGAEGFSPGALFGLGAFELPVYNMVPPPGVPAQFAFQLENSPTFLDAGVRSGSDYGITETSENIAQNAGIMFSATTIWGVPADPSHDPQRRSVLGCGNGCASSAAPKPLLTLPTSCKGPQRFGISGYSWEHPETVGEATTVTQDTEGNPVGFAGCDHLRFAPSISTSPDSSFTDTPVGLTVEVKVPQEGLEATEGLAMSNIEGTTVTLPEGVAINPGQAAGLQGCPETEASLKANDAVPVCPNASRVGTVEIETPLLERPLQGNVYILQGDPPNLRLLVAASGEGVNLKIVGHVHLDEATGRLVTTFSGTPEVPFTNFKLSFSGGAQAALATPTECGVYSTTSDFTSWSSPFVQDAFPTSSFQITNGTNGAVCPGSSLPFSPTLTAGSTTDQAGGFTSFSLLLQAPDDQQRIEKLQFKVPQGLLGMISQVPLCGEPLAANGTCGPASQIGHTVVASGPGPYPLVVPQPGQPPAGIYLTGSYKGAPYGLSIVVPLVVGPFTLQTQIVRAKIEVDPLTAQITVTTDPLPQVIDGVPTDLRTVNAVIDRPGFMFNPTNCAPMSFSGTAWGTPPPGVGGPGATAAISSPFQMGSCRSLLFKPNFKVSTSGKTSRKNGASLDAKIVYPRGLLGANQASSQSNLKSVKVDLPKQLPSRLTTLQKACTSQVFEANPANCPADSRVGSASAVTPVLPVTLTGPAYFVSYGGAKFPELVFALQGYGVTIYVHGETFINKAGITSSTFHQVPDVPIYEFELKLPQGPFSALAANGNLCKIKLKLPTSFTAQDGATLKQSTPISVTGCAKQKIKKKAVKQKQKSKQEK